ncbi:MAG: enoyl-CoA hydratase/isomerase family protein [Negativicutes bacterium]|nr:enoyl-CoA hydratase/isomerase family protein [Negativicutes bacterium]
MNYVFMESRENIATLTIRRPQALNALNSEVLQELSEAFAALAADQSLSCLVLRGAEGKAFVAGADISEMQDFTPEQAYAFSQNGNRVFAQLEQLSIPSIALVQGYALGGGMELAMACDLRVASTRAVFGQPETGLGITPAFGGSFRLARLVGLGQAKRLLFSGETIQGEEAYRIGLVEYLAEPAELEALLERTLQRIGQCSRSAVREAKQLLMAQQTASLAADCQREAGAFQRCFATEDRQERMAAFLQRGRSRQK